MWNEKTKQLVADGKLVVIGVVQEQHSDRAALYKQWKQYDFPIVQDSNTELGLAVVPVPMLIDEYGYVQNSRPNWKEIDALVAAKATKPDKPAPKLNPDHRTIQWLESNGELSNPRNAIALADQHMREASVDSIEKAIKLYEQCDTESFGDAKKSNLGALYFRLGVAYRMLYDESPQEQKNADDFNSAAKYWSKALDQNPNQYIWRRRIQQYGPQQIKPYPFYDWVDQARKEIVARGETPIKLNATLTEAEIAKPSRRFTSAKAETNPDPDARITIDEENLIDFHVTVVPAVIKPGETAAVHIQFSPNSESTSKWNNESSELTAWINQSEAGRSAKTLLKWQNPNSPTSTETRKFEFEFATSKDAKPNADGVIELKGFALFNACKSNDGQCLFRRMEFSIPISVK